MAGIIVVRDGDQNLISKFKAPKKASEVIGGLHREGKLLDSDDIQLVGEDSLEAGDYTFIPEDGSLTATLGACQLTTSPIMVSTIPTTPLGVHHRKSLEENEKEEFEEKSSLVPKYEQQRNERVAVNEKRFLELFPDK